MEDNKRIAKNTLFLYFRMILIMGVTLYTSRVVLDKLGITDYGLYNVVGGIVGMLSFLNATLSSGTSRFLTFELGTGNAKRLARTFSTAFYTHVLLAIGLLFVMETLGVWFFYNKLVIPPDRLIACFWVFQFSIITTIITILQVPYTATIMAHEYMNIYAYISIFETLAKLLVCYLLIVVSFDRLIFYAAILTFVQLLTSVLYVIICVRNCKESKLDLIFDKQIFRTLIKFSGWNIIANITETLKLQGVIILLNIFFTSAIVAAQSIANQVSSAILLFVNNFRLAINPQIIKLYASGDKKASKRLTLSTTVYCFDLILMLGLPAIFVMDKLLHLWLVEVPDYAIVFTQWMVVNQIVGTFNAAFYIPMMAANKVKSNSVAAMCFGIGQFIVLYTLLKLGLGVMWVQYLALLVTTIFSVVVKPYILYKEIDYTFGELMRCYWVCIKVLILSLTIAVIANSYLSDSFVELIVKVVVIGGGVMLSSFLFLDKVAKQNLIFYVKKKIKISK